MSFSYNASNAIIKDLNLSLPKGKITGILGASGSGKSTLLRLIMRFWDVDHGIIEIGQKRINEVNTCSLRSLQSFVTQETFMFNDTIEENIRLGNPSSDSSGVVDAAKMASIHDFILQLPNGYKTKINGFGENLSEGEKQRIGLARAFLHNGSILLLDEPTSNVDCMNEKVILSSIKREAKHKTVVLVSHRQSTLSIADSIDQMDELNMV